MLPDEDNRPQLEYDDMIINKRKFRVPEKIIRLDFWAKIGRVDKWVEGGNGS